MNRLKCAAYSALLVILLLFLSFTSSQSFAASAKPQGFASRLPLSFEQNVGQTDARVRYLTRNGRFRMYLTQDSAVLDIAGVKGRSAVVRTVFTGASSTTNVIGVDPQHSTSNYLVGPRTAWKTAIPNYAKVAYTGIYPGVDLLYYGSPRGLEYDFAIAAKADPSVIALTMEGTEKLSLSSDGDLVVQTGAGQIRWDKPVAYQFDGHVRKLVRASYQVSGNLVRFAVGRYDRRKTLIIDPVLDYGTYIDGSTGFDNYVSLKVDSAGFAYVLGFTSSTDFPTTPGAYQRSVPSTLDSQTFVSKISQDGSFLVWSTIVGGSGPNNNALPSDFALDSTGNIYIVGSTFDVTYADLTGTPTYYASTFPTTANAYNSDHLATTRYFLLKLNISGSAIDYSTFLSNQPNILAQGVAVDVSGSAYVTGNYSQAGGLTAKFPCTAGAYQCAYAGNNDAFVMKFNPEGTKLDYATLVGGSQSDNSQRIVVDTNGEATIAGSTYSTNYPTTANGLRQTDEGGFVTTLNSTGTALVYSTVLNHVLDINIKRDTAGNYYAGGSAGTNLPVSANAYQKTFPAVGTQIHLGFLTVINAAGHLVYSSYIAGNPPSTFIEDTQVQLVSLQSVTVAGNRFSDPTFPVTDRSYEQDDCSFLATFNPEASSGSSSLVYSGCTPINITNNLVHEQFRGFLFFNGALMYLDPNQHLYGLSEAGQTSVNAFQKAPPNPGSGDGEAHVWVGKYTMNVPGSGGVNVSGPYQWGAPYSIPILYRATARSPHCAAGIAAMRVYVSPGVVANTTQGATLNAYISFPSDGSYNTVIVAYDNCGHAFTIADPILVQDTSGGIGSISVAAPVSGAVVSSPVHFMANAQVTNCAKGIAAMRIYTAPGVNAYTVHAANLDTHIALSPGTYNTVIQAWDNCGKVYQAPVTIAVR